MTALPEALWAWRDFQADDGPRCLEVFDSNVPEFFSTQDRAEFERFVQAPKCPYFVVLMDGILVGCGGFYSAGEPHVAHLAWGFVDRLYQGRGVGRHLLERRLELAEDAGATVVRLNTSQRTCGFFEALGFRILAVTENGYGPGLHKVAMERSLV